MCRRWLPPLPMLGNRFEFATSRYVRDIQLAGSCLEDNGAYKTLARNRNA